MEWNQLFWYGLAVVGGVAAGYALGTRSARKMRRRVLEKMNAQSMELLDVKAEVKKLRAYASKQKRKDNLLKLTLAKLQQANKLVSETRKQLEISNRKHFIALSRMRLRALQARATARKAAGIARKAVMHLERLEKSSSVTQTIEAPELKSYGNSDPVTVGVVDHPRLDDTAQSVAQVSNRDSVRLSKLRSSNEARAR